VWRTTLARYKKLTAPEEILNKLGKEEFSVSFRWHAATALTGIWLQLSTGFG
jgi:hypothetical protein